MGSDGCSALSRFFLRRGSGPYAAIFVLTAHLAACAAFNRAVANLPPDLSYTVTNYTWKYDPIAKRSWMVSETKRHERSSARPPSSSEQASSSSDRSMSSAWRAPGSQILEGWIAEFSIVGTRSVRLSADRGQLLAVLDSGKVMHFKSSVSPPLMVTGIEGAVDVAQTVKSGIVCIRYADGTVACGPQTSETSVALTKVPNLRGVDSLQMSEDVACASGGRTALQCWPAHQPSKPFAMKGASNIVGSPFACRGAVCVKQADGTQTEITWRGETAPSPSNFSFLEESAAKGTYWGVTACTLTDGALQCQRLDPGGKLSRVFSVPGRFRDLSSDFDTDVCAVDSDGEVQCLDGDTTGETTRKVMLNGRPIVPLAGTLRSSGFGVCAIRADNGAIVCWRANFRY